MKNCDMIPILISRKTWEIGISTLCLRWYAISRKNSRFANLRIFATSIFSPFQGSLLHSKMRIHNFLSWPSIWIFLEVTHYGNLNFILPQILREIINKLSKGVFTWSILTSCVTILVCFVIILTSIEPILEIFVHLQV